MKKFVSVAFAILLFIAENNFAQGRPFDGDYQIVRRGAVTVMDYFPLGSQGEWFRISPNQVVWRPFYVSEFWRPYSVGRWIWTDYGWYWDSYEPFGQIVYHYGRWNYDSNLGWIWFPDYEWSPAWVEWRYSSSYIGWAPLPPNSVRRRNAGAVNISYNDSYYYWNFVGYNDFYGRNLERHLIHGYRASTVFTSSKRRKTSHYRNGTVFNGGIDREIIERRSGRQIRTSNVSDRIYRFGNKGERKAPERNGVYQHRTGRGNVAVNRSGSEKSKSRERNRDDKSRKRNSERREVRNHR